MMTLDWEMTERAGQPIYPSVAGEAKVMDVVAIYADGGVIRKNPSDIGGTWAWCGVDADGNRVIERGGVCPAKPGQFITNNHMEQIAITLALEAMPEGWTGKVCSDSMIALGRVFKGWREKNLPVNVSQRSAAAAARLGKIEAVLLQGHPTKADLERGIGKKRGFPVSIHNVWCDKECGRQAEAFLSSAAVAA
jgi:ribonuclease HI